MASYLSRAAHQYAVSVRFTELAGEISEGRAGYVLERITTALNDRGKPLRGSHMLLLGIAGPAALHSWYASPVAALVLLLLQKGAVVTYYDPDLVEQVLHDTNSGIVLSSEPLTEVDLQSKDVVILGRNHPQFDWATLLIQMQLVVDTCHATRTCTSFRDLILSV